MKTIFIETRDSIRVKIPEAEIKKLPKNIALFTTVQYIDSINEVKKDLEKHNKNVLLLKPKRSKYAGQLLGCSIENFKEDFDAFLFIGNGLFHPQALVFKNEKPVFMFDPYTRKIFQPSIVEFKKKQKGALLKFLSSSEIGVLVSTKPGQNRLNDARKLQKRYPTKNFYYLLFDTIDFSQLENFSFIECFVNTACPRIAYDEVGKAIINIDDLN